MLKAEDLRIALQELEAVRQSEATALRDSRATFAVLDALIAERTLDGAIDALLKVVATEFSADCAVLCRAPPDGSPIRFVRTLSNSPLDDSGVVAGPGFLDRPRRLTNLSTLAAAGSLDPMVSAIIAPLPMPDEPGLAILCLSRTKAQFHHSDLNRLVRMARVAAQPLSTLRLSRRNADLAALISGQPLDESPPTSVAHVFDQPFRAVNHAVDRLTRAQGLAVSILNRILTAQGDELDQAIQQALSIMGQQCGCDRVHVFQVTAPGRISNTYEWVVQGITPKKDQLQDIPLDLVPHWLEALRSGQDVHVADSAQLADDAPEKAMLMRIGIKSLVITPMLNQGELEGFVGYDALQVARSFLPGEIFLLRAISNATAAMLRKRQSEQRSLRAQQDLDLERARLKATLDALPDLVIELDASGRFRENYSNGSVQMRRIAHQLLGRTLEEALPPDLVEAARRMLEEVAACGHTEGHTFQYRISQNDLRWIRANATRRESPYPGGTAGFLFVLRDITTEVDQAREIAILGEVAKRTSNLVVVTDREGRITWVNASFEQVSGWSRHEVIGKVPGHFLQPPDVDKAAVARIAAAVAHGRPIKEELSNIARNGRRYWISLDIQPLSDEKGQLTGFIAVQNDVTEAKMQAGALAAAAEAARRSRAQLSAAVEALDDGFVYFDRTGAMVVCNERYRAIAPEVGAELVPGITLEQILRKGLQHGIYPDAIGNEEAWLARRLAAQNSSDVVTIEQRLTNGNWVRIFDKRTPDGGRVGLRVDITALKEAEARALSDRAAAMDAAHDGMAITGPDGTLLYANSAFLDILHLQGQPSLLGSHWSVLFDQDAQADLSSRALSAMTQLGDRWSGVVEGHLTDGTKTDLEISLSRRGDGALVWVLRDLTERRAAEVEHNRMREALQTAQRREVIGQLAAGLAHDFNNLIAAISGSATLILEDDAAASPDRAKSHALRIQKSAERAEAMVRRLLALGARPASHQLTDLVPVLREAAELLRPGLGQTVRLAVDLPTAPLMTALEPTDVLQIVLNLGINARDAMLQFPQPDRTNQISLSLRIASPADMASPSAGRYRLGTADPARPHACLTVTDTGPGIRADQAESIFAPYFSTKGEKGSGLGLTIVAGVVKAAGGSIELTECPKGGASFTVLLPLADAADMAAPHPAVSAQLPAPPQPPSDPAAAPPPSTRPQPLKGRSILIVDDAEDVLTVLAALLERAGAEVAPTSDAEVAYEVLCEDPDAFDLVITDFDMGPLTGADLARAVHSERPNLPVILVTALPDWRLRDSSGAADPSFFTVLAKPVSSEALVGSAIAALDSRQN